MVDGLAANHTPSDWILSAAALPIAEIGSLLHRETDDFGVPTAQPGENLAAIRLTGRVIPGRKSLSKSRYPGAEPVVCFGSLRRAGIDSRAHDGFSPGPFIVDCRSCVGESWHWESARSRHLVELRSGPLGLTLAWRPRWGCAGSASSAWPVPAG